MNDSTKQLFDAPWYVEDDGFCVSDRNRVVLFLSDHPYGNERDRADIHRVSHLPELYDALMYFVVNDCPHVFISNDECRLCPDKKCKTREAVKLLRKVRDGE